MRRPRPRRGRQGTVEDDAAAGESLQIRRRTEPKPFTLKELDGVSVTSFIRVAANVIVAAGIFEFEVELPCKCVRRFYLSTHPRIDATRCTEAGDATPQPKDH
jgi:hypothetical protein